MSEAPGVKLDRGKIQSALIFEDFPRALSRVAEVATFGANKYTRSGWVGVPNRAQRYADALFRHLLAAYQGEERDAESGHEHLAHAAWNLLAVLEIRERDRNELE